MKCAVIFSTCAALLVLLPFGSADNHPYAPKFCSMSAQCQRAAKQEFVGHFAGRDKGMPHALFLLRDDADEPLLFYADITTPVCIDDICKPVRIGLYWDLVGNYVGYGVPKGFPLTKYDHVPFQPVDYMKFHQVLSDRVSILGCTELADMFDPTLPTDERNLTYRGQHLDAVSGATTKEVRQSIVEGALYTCYAIWHIAHGNVRERIADHWPNIESPALTGRLLNSENPGYQLHAVQRMDHEQLKARLPRVLQIVRVANPDERFAIMRSLPTTIWRMESATRVLYSVYPALQSDEKEWLIRNLPDAHASASAVLADHVAAMAKKQLKAYLAFLTDNPNRLTAAIQDKLRRIVSAEKYAYCYVVDEYLRNVAGGR
jgi:hypothetical protein